MSRRPVQLLTQLLVALVALVALTDIAEAHEGEGVLTVESVQSSDEGTVLRVRLTWANDGHPAADATITATPVDPAGAPLTPVPLSPIDDDGRYEAAIALGGAGTWTIRVTSVTPIATAETTVDVVPPSTESPSSAPSTDSSTTIEATSPIEDPATTGTVSSVPEDSNGRGTAIFVSVLAVIAIGAGLLIWRTSRKLDGV